MEKHNGNFLGSSLCRIRWKSQASLYVCPLTRDSNLSAFCTFPFRRYFSYPIHLSIHCYTVRAQEVLFLCHVSKISSWCLILILVGETFCCSDEYRRPLAERKCWHFLESKGTGLSGRRRVVTVTNERFDRDLISDHLRKEKIYSCHFTLT